MASASIKLRTAAEIADEIPAASWLLRPYLEANSIAVCFGDFGTYKSFLALDWSLRVALGLPAIGSTSLRPAAPVVFISAEGRGLWKRLRAWCRHEYAERDWQAVLDGTPLHMIERPVNLSDAGNARSLVAAIAELGITPALVVIDTLSRNSNGEVESSTADAAAYLAILDQHLRAPYGCHVLLVHHVGHTEKDRIRGPIVIAANTDTLIHVERPVSGDPVITVTVGRAKDSEPPAPVSLRAVVVDIGVLDEDGKPTTSLALEDNGVPVVVMREPGGKHPPALLAGLREWRRAHPELPYITHDDFQAVCVAQGIPRQRKPKAIEMLKAGGFLTDATGGFRLDV